MWVALVSREPFVLLTSGLNPIRSSMSPAQITILLLRAEQRNCRSIDGTGIIPQFNVQRLSLWPRDG